MADPDLYSLLSTDDAVTAEEQTRALANALRRRQEVGTLMALSGGRMAAPGNALLHGAEGDTRLLETAATARAARRQAASLAAQKAMEDKRDFEYRQKHDAETLGQQQMNAKAQLALAGASLGLRTHEVNVADNEKAKADVERHESQVRELAAKVGDNPALVAEKMSRVQQAMQSTPPGGLPGIGRSVSLLPDSMVSNEGRDLRSDAAELVNVLLFLQSGAGVSNRERDNKYAAYGLGTGASEEAFRTGMTKLQNDLAKALKAKEAGFKPSVVSTYQERGGVVPESIAPKTILFTDGKQVREVSQADLPAALATPGWRRVQ